MPDPLVLAVDLGTSGVKAALVAADGQIASTGLAPITTTRVEGGGAEQDPDEVLDRVARACRHAVGGVPAPRRADVVGIAVCSQYSSIIPVDAQARPVMNMVVWMDGRGAPRALRALDGGRALIAGPLSLLRYLRAHGVPPLDSGADSLAHMRWIKLARPDVYARTAAFLEPADFVTAWMTGRIATNPCSAFMMLVVDNRRLATPRYHPGLVRLSGIDPGKLPELLPIDQDVGTLRPEVAERLGLPAGLRVFAACNDTQAGSGASFSLTGSHAGLGVGTTSVMVTHVPFKGTDIRNSLTTMPSPVVGQYTLVAENGVGGGAVEHFLRRVVFAEDAFADHTSDDAYAGLARAVESTAPGADGVLFLPWLGGSFAPVDDGRVRGGFFNMSLETGRSQLGRAVLEGIALNFRWLRGAVQGFLKRELSHFVLYGGGAQIGPWPQIFADVLGVPIHRVENPRFAVCRGVALIGFCRCGLATPDDLGRRVPIAGVATPRPEHAARYQSLYEQFVRAFHRARPVFRALNDPRRPR